MLYGPIHAMHADADPKRTCTFDLLSEHQPDGPMLDFFDYVVTSVGHCSRTHDCTQIDKRTHNCMGKRACSVGDTLISYHSLRRLTCTSDVIIPKRLLNPKDNKNVPVGLEAYVFVLRVAKLVLDKRDVEPTVYALAQNTAVWGVFLVCILQY